MIDQNRLEKKYWQGKNSKELNCHFMMTVLSTCRVNKY